ncbi:MAG: tRNA pseudouridine(13) synthase TruD [Bacillota bacterium]|nr:tRNA pseudouridine(13) synthase TruD [Bacillota bacterium]
MRPEDFRVSEESRLALADGGPFGVYLLAKTGWTTPEALDRAARDLGLPYGVFRYGGLKDRWAVTEQTVTVRTERDCSGEWNGFSLRALGRAADPMSPGAIVANRFRIVLRDLSACGAATAAAEAARLPGRGFANYFDDQRFGSMRDGQLFAGDLIVRRDWAGALRALLAMSGPDDPSAIRHHRRELARRWGDWPACLEAADGPAESQVFRMLAHEPRAVRAAVNLLPRETLAFHLAAWQSHLWNEVLRQAVRRAGEDGEGGVGLRTHPGTAGPYLSPARPDAAERLLRLVLPTLGRGIAWPDAPIEELYRGLLAPLGLRPENFVLRGLPKVQLRSSLRPAAVTPRELEVSGPAADAFHPGRCSLELGFSLPPGSYGTMLVKALSSTGP